jgi:flagellar biosynthesis/type III secretory pathway ATPase
MLDAAIRVRPKLLSFLKQEPAANSPLPETLHDMQLLAAALG